ncbi:hypothetical protein C8R46DRAFT_1191781 [Mycena filopes]|nr:hypothetical protein C8R46DRAFT_1191781 [Mycena filopes]
MHSPRRTHRKRISALRLSSDTTNTLPEYFRDPQPPPEYEADADDDRTDDPDETLTTTSAAAGYVAQFTAPVSPRRQQQQHRSHRRRTSSPPLAPLPQDAFLDSLLERSVHALELSNALLQSSMSTPTSSTIMQRERDEEDETGEPPPIALRSAPIALPSSGRMVPPSRSRAERYKDPESEREPWADDLAAIARDVDELLVSSSLPASVSPVQTRKPRRRPSLDQGPAHAHTHSQSSSSRATTSVFSSRSASPSASTTSYTSRASNSNSTASHTSHTSYTSTSTAGSGSGLRIASHARARLVAPAPRALTQYVDASPIADHEEGQDAHVRLPSTIGLRSGGSEWGLGLASNSSSGGYGHGHGTHHSISGLPSAAAHPHPAHMAHSHSYSHSYTNPPMSRSIAGLPHAHAHTIPEEESGASASSSYEALVPGQGHDRDATVMPTSSFSQRGRQPSPRSRGRQAHSRDSPVPPREDNDDDNADEWVSVPPPSAGPARIGSAMGREGTPAWAALSALASPATLHSHSASSTTTTGGHGGKDKRTSPMFPSLSPRLFGVGRSASASAGAGRASRSSSRGGHTPRRSGSGTPVPISIPVPVPVPIGRSATLQPTRGARADAGAGGMPASAPPSSSNIHHRGGFTPMMQHGNASALGIIASLPSESPEHSPQSSEDGCGDGGDTERDGGGGGGGERRQGGCRAREARSALRKILDEAPKPPPPPKRQFLPRSPPPLPHAAPSTATASVSRLFSKGGRHSVTTKPDGARVVGIMKVGGSASGSRPETPSTPLPPTPLLEPPGSSASAGGSASGWGAVGQSAFWPLRSRPPSGASTPASASGAGHSKRISFAELPESWAASEGRSPSSRSVKSRSKSKSKAKSKSGKGKGRAGEDEGGGSEEGWLAWLVGGSALGLGLGMGGGASGVMGMGMGGGMEERERIGGASAGAGPVYGDAVGLLLLHLAPYPPTHGREKDENQAYAPKTIYTAAPLPRRART